MLMERADTVWQIDQTRPIAPQLHRVLRERVVQNDLRPGQKISESEIAAHYGVSRQPVREAFIRLSDEGLIAILPQRGTRIRRIGLNAVRESRFIRESIEADIVKLLAERPDPATIGRLRDLIDRQQRMAEGDPFAFIKADEDFHRALASSASKEGIWQRVQGLKAQMDRVRFLSLGHFPVRKLIDQHAAIVEGIAKGDVAAAENALRRHLREVLNDLPLIVQESPDFFDAVPDGAEERVVELQGGETV